MTLTVNVSPEAETWLLQKAALNRVPLTELVSGIIEEASQQTEIVSRPTTGAELIAQLEADGVIGVWADRSDIGDSAAYARELRRQAEHREW
ncbi:MAG: hypothetical protein ACLQVD_12115 [Capsulimonadaceae bacterium]